MKEIERGVGRKERNRKRWRIRRERERATEREMNPYFNYFVCLHRATKKEVKLP